ncbi:MAG TPA: ATP-dependent DNA helicase RecG [Patescibacteria group bacterium]|nr:ATP-dependent DNA helicase RecG [Patescibacteria group bacterium]
MNDAASRPLASLRGVGPAIAEALSRLSLHTLADLWFHLPLRYEDRTRITPIRDLRVGESAQVEAVVDAVERGFRFRPLLRVTVSDDSRSTLTLRFFHFSKTQAESFVPGIRLRIFGEVREGANGLEIVHPRYQRVQPGAPLETALTPVYPATEGIGQATLIRLARLAIAALPEDDGLDVLPDALRRMAHLPSLGAALRLVHAPSNEADLPALLARTHPAQQRLAFDELLAHQIGMRKLRRHLRAMPAPSLKHDNARRGAFIDALPFVLTGAQQRVLGDIDRDLVAGKPMLRLVQGDVGSGKTVVAALAALAAADARVQTAVMAPTELLAEQHLQNFRRWCEPFGLRVVWLAGKVTGKARSKALADIAAGADIVIGTHALMQEGVVFANLGLAIIDEQHRFGVHQRLSLRNKGRDGTRTPHQLVMTATPIPRTLAMAAYADLDVSVIDELPPGRTPVQTVAVADARRDEIVDRIRVACAEGRQAYWVCPLIEESDLLEAKAAQVTHEELRLALPDVHVGLLHGRMRPRDKQAVMAAFKGGEIRLLVATTVIEVGVDVPNASLMVIDNAERLGLAQLHQLRGRVGRGAAASSCVLVWQPPLSPLARERLAVMRETNDGFRIAEKDLELRGPGEVVGTRQTGEMSFRVADLVRDAEVMPKVAQAADWLLEHDPQAADALVVRWIGQAVEYAQA